MITLFKRVLWSCVVALVPVVISAQTVVPATKPAFSDTQLAEGLRSGLTTFSSQVLVAGAIKVPTPPLFTKSKDKLEAAKKTDTLVQFENALGAVVKKLEPKIADEIRKALKTVKFVEPKKIFEGGGKTATEFFRKAAISSLNDTVLPMIRTEITAADLTSKCRAVVAVVDPFSASGGNQVIVDLDYYIRKQMLDQSFALIAKQETVTRANPALLKVNTPAQAVFEAYKK
jgi:hypothetical protein